MKKPKGIDLRYEWEVREITRTSQFTVIRYEGRDGEKIRHEVGSLAEALELAEFVGSGRHGRTPMIYAVTVDRMSIHVDERHLRMLEEKGGGQQEHC